MKIIYPLIICLITLGACQESGAGDSKVAESKVLSLPNTWAWMRGGRRINRKPGVYGERGITSSKNVLGGRYGSTGWADNEGNLWIFGGHGYSSAGLGTLNDLWKVDNKKGYWTWMGGSKLSDQLGVYGEKGISSIENTPGARYMAMSWTDANGNFWLFGGYKYIEGKTGYFNDLWKYDLSINQWAWMGGSKTTNKFGKYGERGIPSDKNFPGSRYKSVSWADSKGNLWLFGGYGYSSKQVKMLKDLWKYDTSTKEWAWMGGEKLIDDSIKEIGPYARFMATGWVDGEDNLWLFGGRPGIHSSQGLLNDLWKYNTTSNSWEKMGGSETPNQKGIYGKKGIPSKENFPGARYYALGWSDRDNNFWLFGGNGFTASKKGLLNDLWKYDTKINQWAWMGKGTNPGMRGTFGKYQVPSQKNTPGSRYMSVNFTDSDGNFWLFGGYGYTTFGKGRLNDLWKFNPE